MCDQTTNPPVEGEAAEEKPCICEECNCDPCKCDESAKTEGGEETTPETTEEKPAEATE